MPQDSLGDLVRLDLDDDYYYDDYDDDMAKDIDDDGRGEHCVIVTREIKSF